MAYKTYLARANNLKEVIHVSWDNKGIEKTDESDAKDGAPLFTSLTRLFRYKVSRKAAAMRLSFWAGSYGSGAGPCQAHSGDHTE